MKPVENHMVALPQPELDHEEKCDHSYPFDIIDIHDYDESSVWFEVKCPDCGKIGYVEGAIILERNVEWDEE